jgi:hypothetical protein
MADYGLGGLFSGFVEGFKTAKNIHAQEEETRRANEEHTSRMKDAEMRQKVKQAQLDIGNQANDIVTQNLMTQNPQSGKMMMRPDVTPEMLDNTQRQILPLTVRMAGVAGDASGMSAALMNAHATALVQNQREALGVYNAMKADPQAATPAVVDYFNKLNGSKIDPATVQYDPKRGYVAQDGTVIPLGLPMMHAIRTALDPMQAFANLTHANTAMGQESRAQQSFDTAAPVRAREAEQANAERPYIPGVAQAAAAAARLKPDEIRAGISAKNASAAKDTAEAQTGIPAHADYFKAQAELARETKVTSADARTSKTNAEVDKMISDRLLRAFYPGKTVDTIGRKDREQLTQMMGVARAAVTDEDNKGVAPETIVAAVKTASADPTKLSADALASIDVGDRGEIAVQGVKLTVSPDVAAALQKAKAKSGKKAGMKGAPQSSVSAPRSGGLKGAPSSDDSLTKATDGQLWAAVANPQLASIKSDVLSELQRRGFNVDSAPASNGGLSGGRFQFDSGL